MTHVTSVNLQQYLHGLSYRFSNQRAVHSPEFLIKDGVMDMSWHLKALFCYLFGYQDWPVTSLDVSRSSSLLNIWVAYLLVLNKHVQIIPQGFDIRHCQFLFSILRIEKATVEFLRTRFIKQIENPCIEAFTELKSFSQAKNGRY